MDNEKYEFFSSGGTLLDLALGGGWAMQHIYNIVGDKSTGKTLLAIEGMANFKMKYPKGKVRYGEAEAAFDTDFAKTLGFPDDVERPDEPLNTVEDFELDFKKFVAKGGPSLYILDSLDALSDEAELKKWEKNSRARETGAEETGSFGAAKAKKMSEFFRKLVREVQTQNSCLGVISQIRDRIGVSFGETKTRSGGKALDFYASQVLWLQDLGKITKTSLGELRPIGVSIRAKVKKCKVGMPFRETEFPIIFGYGIDDEVAMLEWLSLRKRIDPEYAKATEKALIKARNSGNYEDLATIKSALQADATKIWQEIEANLAPPIAKYGHPKVVQKAEIAS